MNTFKILVLSIALTSFLPVAAQADCNPVYATAIGNLRSNQESSQMIGLSVGIFGAALAYSRYGYGTTMGKGILVGGVAAGVLIATLGTVSNSPKDLVSAAKLVDESQKGDGLMVQMLRSDLKAKGINISTADLATKVMEFNHSEILCPQDAEKTALGYTMILQLMLRTLAH